MKAKFGFLIESLRGLGITNPEDDFISARIKSWAKKPGDAVTEGEIIVEVETDKVTEELQSAWTGIIFSITYQEDEEWEVGVTKDEEELPARSEDTPFGRILLPELGYIEIDDVAEETVPEKPVAKEVEVVEEVSHPEEEPRRAGAAPVARRIAREQGIDINTVEGTGLGGRIMRADVEEMVAEQSVEERVQPEPEQVFDDREPLNAMPIRKAIAHYMAKSHEEIPKAGDAITIDVTNLRKFYRERRETWREDTGTDFSFTGLFMFMATRLLHDQRKKFGIINAYWDKDKKDAYLFKHVNVGIAIQAPEGLMVPVIQNAETLSFRDLMLATHDKVQRAMILKIKLPELRDLTFTVNNVGAMGGENPDSIVPYTKETSGKERPTGMILVLGAIKQFPDDKFISELIRLFDPMLMKGVIKKKEDFNIRYNMTLAFSFDHRLFDGVPALEFVNALKQYIESKSDSEEFRELFSQDFVIK